MKNNQNLLLICLLSLALLIRLPLLTQIPKGLNIDEIAYAYNAFSIMETGRDEWDVSYPLFLKSYGDFKPALFSYLLIPAFSIFDNWDFVLRFIPVILSVISIAASYGFFYLLTRSKTIGLLSSMIISISPWHIYSSRLAMDPILGFALMLVGMNFWLFSDKNLPYKSDSKLAKRIKNILNKKYFKSRNQVYHVSLNNVLGLLFLALSMFSYNSQRIVVPLIIIFYILIFWSNNLKASLKKYYLTLIPFFLISILLFAFAMLGKYGTRAQDIYKHAYERSYSRYNETFYRSQITKLKQLPLVDNAIFYQFTDILKYSSLHFSPDFLFFEGRLRPEHGYSQYGVLLLFSAPFFLIGLFKSISKSDKVDRFLLSIMLIGVLPSSYSIDAPNPGRTLTLLLAISYFVAIGIVKGVSLFNKSQMKRIVLIIIVIVLGLNFAFYYRDFFLYYPEESEIHFQGHYEGVVEYIFKERNKYEKIHLTNYYGEPLLFYAWYNKINPLIVQRSSRDPLFLNKLGNVEVLDVESDLNKQSFGTNDLVIVSPNQVEFSVKPIKTFYFYNRYYDPEVAFFLIRGGDFKDQLEMKL